ncbi:hypothetical protein EEL31_10385 [Brevibacillus laterosporus]|nr:hypothetical protein [Brevibacillus laterosporus]TPG68896.1 hypothetical protein EEL31_10385 [Brevibacillus laterosporus]
MPKFKSIDELNKYLAKQISESLNEVGDATKNTMQKHVKTDVYDAYTPTQYDRTGQLRNDIEVKVKGNTVSISPIRRDGDKYIPTIIETGHGYDWKNSNIYQSKQKRPFVQNTENEIVKNDLHIKTMKKSLKKRKWIVE